MSKAKSIFLRDICRPRQWPTLSIGDLVPTGFPVYGANGRIGFAPTFTHEKPVLLVGCRGSCGTLHITEPRSYANGNAMALDNFDESKANLRWIFYFLYARGFSDVISGSSQPQITQSNIGGIELSLPSLLEQERAVRVLDEAEALRRLRMQADQKTDRLVSALLEDTFGEPSSNPFKWPVKTLCELLAVPLQNGVSPATEGTITDNVLTLSAITGNQFDSFAVKGAPFSRQPEPSKRVKAGQFLICRGNGNIQLVGAGKFAAPDAFGYVFPDTMISAEFDSQAVVDEFIDALWRTPYIRSQIQSSARTTNGAHKINQMSLELVSFPVPSLDLQRSFAVQVKEIKALQTAQTASRQRLDDLLKSLLYRAFQGEL